MVRFAKDKDLPFLKEAWKVCFDDPQDFIDWNFKHNFSCKDTLIAEADGTPASNLQLMPHRIRLRDTDYAVNYVSGVATLPKFRNRGLVRELFAFAFEEMKKRGHAISLLVPFHYGFYEKFGYRQCYNKVFRYTDALPEGEPIQKDLTPSLITALDRLYRLEMQSRTGYALRTPSDWQKIFEDLLYLSQGLVWLSDCGYALLSPRKEGGWELHEVCGICTLPYREEVKPFAMARILDPIRVLTNLSQTFDGCLHLRLRDENLPENNLCLTVTKGSVVPGNTFDFDLSIGDLAALVFGFWENPALCDLFSKQDPYLNMIF